MTFNNFSFQGFIRNIDIGRKAFVILTPLPFEKLINVNALLKGNIDIPLELIETVSSFIGNYYAQARCYRGSAANQGGVTTACIITVGGGENVLSSLKIPPCPCSSVPGVKVWHSQRLMVAKILDRFEISAAKIPF